eukprot:TRINITY_DN6213_c0_g1_i3.p1 TRINITY_DN6213_c0_g1~~TRINITY_DN6213_c0_g1_i3.p1  ORF type:complete len:557 (+),score=136.96 TRINITY_DN6213_c0_g1_i3:43-1671(+)
MSDPLTGAPKGFGYVDYETAEGVLRALRILNGLHIEDESNDDDSENSYDKSKPVPPLVLTVEEKARKILDEYVAQRNAEQHKNSNIFQPDVPEGEPLEQTDEALRVEEEEDDRARKRIFQILDMWKQGQKKPEEKVEKLDKSAQNITITPPPYIEKPASAAAVDDLVDKGVDKDKAALVNREINLFRERQAARDQEKKERDREERERHYQDELRDEAEREKQYLRERQNARERARLERDRERRKMEQERINAERDFKEREREWEHREREKEKERERRKEKERRDRDQRIRDVQLAEDDDEFAEDKVHRRHRSKDQRRARHKEREDDEVDRLVEIEESKRKAEEDNHKEEEPNAQTPQHTPTPSTPNTFSPRDNGDSSQIKSLEMRSIRPKLSTAPGFGDHEDEESSSKKKRPLVPLESKQSGVQESAHKKLRPDVLKSLVTKIPSDKKTLFNFEVDWAVVDEHKIVDLTMKPWITRKIKEYLGEEESTLIGFIVSKLSSHTSPQEILDQLGLVLDEDADIFVVKMWRMLAFEMLAAKEGAKL